MSAPTSASISVRARIYGNADDPGKLEKGLLEFKRPLVTFSRPRFFRKPKVELSLDVRLLEKAESSPDTGLVTLETRTYKVELYFDDPNEAVQWHSAIVEAKHALPEVDQIVAALFLVADKDHSGGLNIDEVTSAIVRPGISWNRKEVEARVRAYDDDGSRFLDLTEFEKLYGQLFVWPDARAIFDSYAKGAIGIPPDEFRGLVSERFKFSGALPQRLQMILDRRQAVGFAEFCTLMTDPDINSVVDPEVINRADPMDRPLSHYYIASSHNTYLEDDQLKGKSSALAYQRSFERNCKCVELDLWDGPGGIPEITHGHTLCSKVCVKDVCDVIVRAGFLTEGQYPVILSLENHLSVNQQDTLAEIFEEKFGERLPPRFDRGDDAVLPSPESLAGKILLKGGVCNETTPPQDKSARLSSMIHLGTYSVPKTADFAEKPAFLMFSASETRIEKFANDPVAHQKLRAHNAIHLTRSFPKGSRVGSSNYDPCPGWNTGAQIVALNYQTASEPMWLNEAKFTMNRGRGYVLKPPYIIDPTIPPPGEANPELLKILVIRGGGFPSSRRDIIDPYIELKVVGWKEDTKSQKTKTVRNNGLDPNWGVEFEFPLRAPEMDLLCIYLWDGDAGGDDLVGHFVVPVPAIRPGLRSIPLYDGSRERVRFKGAFVLCNFTKT